MSTITEKHQLNISDFSSANLKTLLKALFFATILIDIMPISERLPYSALFIINALLPCSLLFLYAANLAKSSAFNRTKEKEKEKRSGKDVLGLPPERDAFGLALEETRKNNKIMLDKYLVGFEVSNGKPIWISDEEICGHACVFAKTGVGKTLWMEGIMFQQMARARASGMTFIDAKRDPGTLADIILMAIMTGRIEDLIVVDPFDPVCAYNFVLTPQKPDVKARKVLRCGLPVTSDQSVTKHYDRLASDAVYRLVRAMESLGLAWSIKDITVALSAFNLAYPRLREMLHEKDAEQAIVELGHLASTYKNNKGSFDQARLNDNLRGIASELHSISNSQAGEMFCMPRADLNLTDAILNGKIIYYMLPRLEEAESASKMVKVFREDLEVSIGEVTSNRSVRLEDPHLIFIDEGASTFGPTWANLFELARKGRFSLIFGAQSVGGLMDEQMGLSKQFYERVMANVNLKVAMRLGDNKTAEDMSEWMGKVATLRKSVSTSNNNGSNPSNKEELDEIKGSMTISETEKALVSVEELKHEMSAEKGLAWFDMGDGRLFKGRTLWFESDIPQTWDGRENLVRHETIEKDEIGLAEWINDYILTAENAEIEKYGIEQQNGQAAPPKNPVEKLKVDKMNNEQAYQPENQPVGQLKQFRINPLNRKNSKAQTNTYAKPLHKEIEKSENISHPILEEAVLDELPQDINVVKK
ncbi:MAG: TraM recognition domain-containing protein [Proteobacteria bacterium]|nr:TraM recognition domain-containing protein [Pseudomonadota bacterium]